MAEDASRARAALFIDARHHDERENLSLEHRRQEKRELAFHKSQLQGFERNREISEMRYVQRLRSIEEKRDRIADRLHRQHNSIGGRIEGMTKAGRARQAAQLERLDDRAAALQGRAHRQFEAVKERQFHAEQRDRISRAREMKFLRQDHQQARQSHARQHEATRPQKIEERAKTLKRVEAEQALKQDLQRLQERDRGRSLSR